LGAGWGVGDGAGDGVGDGAGVCAGPAAGACGCAGGAVGASGCAGASGCGGACSATVSDAPDASVGTAAFFVVFLAVFFAGLPAGASALGIASTRRRATGGSMVDDADRTNSPISCNFARTTLLSTPSSLASS